MVEIMMLGGIMTGLSVLTLFMKLGVRKILGYDAILDIMLAVLLMIFFHGTASGMLVALMGGLFISIVMRIMRWTIGYQQLQWVTEIHQFAPFKFKLTTVPVPKLRWVYYPPTWKIFNITPPVN